MTLQLKSPAKINLGLFILGKRPDGYHELETLLQMVSLYDTLELTALPAGIELICDHPGVPSDQTNLVVRAARLLLEKGAAGRVLGCRIHLHKNIPAGAGLGGGSGNAGIVLRGLNQLWQLHLSASQLAEIAAQIGSDVPFFLGSPAALGRGRGERLTALQPAKKFYVILLFPRLAVATSEVYKGLNLDLTKKQKNINILLQFFSESDIASLGAHLHNDLEPIVFKRYPIVQKAKEALGALDPDGVLVSGSGSTVFAIFGDSAKASQAFARLQGGDWDLFLTETVTRLSEFLPASLCDDLKP